MILFLFITKGVYTVFKLADDGLADFMYQYKSNPSIHNPAIRESNNILFL